MDTRTSINVGSRMSQLALIQTNFVIEKLNYAHGCIYDFKIVKMSTLGDRIDSISLPKIGEKALFTADLENALRLGKVDMVVHSLKDLPTSLPPNMVIGAVIERDDPQDAVVLRKDFKGFTLDTLPAGSIIGTSSLRRTAQIRRNHPHLKVIDIRGNLNTRLKKLDYNCVKETKTEEENNSTNNDGANSKKQSEDSNATIITANGTLLKDVPNYVGLILAVAGLNRMGFQDRISQILSSDNVLYAVGQGALAIECMATNTLVLEMLAPLNNVSTYCRILSERSFLKTLDGGCSAPVAVSSSLSEDHFTITGAVWSLNGETKIQDSITHVYKPAKQEDKPSVSVAMKNEKRKHEESNLENLDEKKFKNEENPSFVENISSENKNNSKNTSNECCLKVIKQKEIENIIDDDGKQFSESKKRACPVEFLIGQEVMGECPYFSDEGLKKTMVQMNPGCPRPYYNIGKCPFMANQAITANITSKNDKQEELSEYEDTSFKPSFKTCPFLKPSSDPSELIIVHPESSKEDKDDTKLYCGLIKHRDLAIDDLEMYENLGKQLAEKLIQRGALAVMKFSQNLVRNSITKIPVIIEQ